MQSEPVASVATESDDPPSFFLRIAVALSSQNLNAELNAERRAQHTSLSCLSVVRSGIGLATDLYDLSIINSIRPELEDCYGKMSDSMNGAITSATTAGAIVGQLSFGYVADTCGRRYTFIATSIVLCISALGCALSDNFAGLSVYQVLFIWRFILGIAVGGEYPLSAAVTSEEAENGKSAKSMALTYMMFCVGQLLGPIVVLCCLYSGASSQVTWRVSVGMGSVLALIGAILRIGTMHESQAWLEAREHAKRIRVFRSATTLRAIWRPLLGTMSIYFIYDVVAWGVGGYTSSIFESSTRVGTQWYVLLVYIMATPGFILTLWMGRFGRKTYQLVGFLGMSCCFVLVAISYGHAQVIVLVLIFGCQKIFDSFGPGATTYIIPGEIFPCAIRASCHGASSAAGKLGAFVGMYMFPTVSSAIGHQGTFFLGGLLLCLGALLTCVLTPPYNENTLTNLRVATQKDITCTSQVLWNKMEDQFDNDRYNDRLTSVDALAASTPF